MEYFTLGSLLLITLVNVYWTWQGKKIQNDRDIIKALQIQLSLKEEALQEMVKKKNELKTQFGHQLVMNKKLEGEIKIYKAFHNHPQVD